MKQLTANELRIGNVFNYGAKEAGIFKPTIIDWSDIRLASEYPKEFNIFYHPIPLTEDVLLRFGFENNKKEMVELIYSKYESCYHYRILTKEPFPTNVRIKSAHQLQNLYFALTGHELEFKPESFSQKRF